MTVGRLLASIGSRELSEWQAYERLYGPLGQARDDQLAALISAQVAGTFSGKAVKVAEFMPDWTRRGEVLDGDGS